MNSRRVFGGDAALLIARVLLVVLFVYAGWGKVVGFTGTESQFAANGIPDPMLATLVAVIAELPFALLILVGLFTRPLAILLAIYTLATAVLGHPYWAVPDDQQMNMLLHFYKNVGIAGGFLALYAAGAGRFSLDQLRHRS
ncbi:Inner membrane protein YphA [Carnimonas sp. R-84981]|uniref:DoxX family protein n=1 Tax=Carnimonas bestiolae TaxID=3402172 RepID=UPI003EDC0042